MLGIVLAVLLGLAGSDAARADGGAPRLGFPSPPRFDGRLGRKVAWPRLHLLRLVGRGEGLASPRPKPRLGRENHIRTSHGSLAIEGNTVSIARITAILDGRSMIGPRRDIVEVQKANRTCAVERDRCSPSCTRTCC